MTRKTQGNQDGPPERPTRTAIGAGGEAGRWRGWTLRRRDLPVGGKAGRDGRRAGGLAAGLGLAGVWRTRTVRRENFSITIHAGEAFGPPSIWQALQYCGAHRIGPGVRLVEDMAIADGKVAEPGLRSVEPGNGEMRIPPVSVCHQVSTMGQRPSPTTR